MRKLLLCMIFYFSFSTLFAQKEKLSVGSNFAILLSSEFSSKFGVNFRSEYHLLDYFSLLGNYTICGGTSYLNSKKNSATIYSGDIHLLDFGFKYYFFKWRIKPYVLSDLGVAILNSNKGYNSSFLFDFGLGINYNLNRRIVAQLEVLYQSISVNVGSNGALLSIGLLYLF